MISNGKTFAVAMECEGQANLPHKGFKVRLFLPAPPIPTNQNPIISLKKKFHSNKRWIFFKNFDKINI